jgi:precorrin-6Y C5,15-methyltransferase (decarboxylating)
MTRWLTILGIGEDGVEGLSPAARALLQNAPFVIGGARHLDLAAPLIRGERRVWPRPIADAVPEILARRGAPAVILASGDPFCYGIGSLLACEVPQEEMLCLPAPSAFSLACARLGWPLQEVSTISLCGRPLACLVPLLQPRACILALSADSTTPETVAGFLQERGFGASRITVLEAVGGPRERIRSTTADDFTPDDINPLNLIALEVNTGPTARVIPLAAGLPEEFFEHDGQITKREIRAVTLAALAPCRGELLWDIGCGSGAIGIEWMLRDPANRTVAIEKRPDRAARAARNAAALGVPALDVRIGVAPDALYDLPQPDAVFIGGGAETSLAPAWEALRSGGRIVVNAVTLESEATLGEAWRRFGGSLTRLSVARLDALGGMRAFRPAMTVTQWAAVKP